MYRRINNHEGYLLNILQITRKDSHDAPKESTLFGEPAVIMLSGILDFFIISDYFR